LESVSSKNIKNMDDALNFVYSFINYERKSNFRYDTKTFDMEKFEKFLEDIGSPHLKYKTIHVVGTKGKGSTSAILSSILKQAGYKTGTYTSPHLENIRERIMINGDAIEEKSFVSIMEYLRKFIESNSLELANNYRTTFELLTSTAFLHFAAENVDFAVIEAGLGARLDATNVIKPELVLITSISLDHTNILGDTIDKIAYEKAGAIKNGIHVISSPQHETVREVVGDIAIKNGSEVDFLIKDNLVKNIIMKENGIAFDYSGEDCEIHNLWLPLAGDYQGENALLAIKAFLSLSKDLKEDKRIIIKEGLENVRWRGRLEILSSNPLVVADVAHNPYSMKMLLSRIKSIFEYDRILCVLSISTNKDIPELCRILSSYCNNFYVTFAEPSRSSTFDVLNENLSKNPDNTVCFENSPKIALGKALNEAGKGELVLITGSVYLVGSLLSHFKEDERE